MNNFKSILQTSRILLVLMLLVLFAGCSDDDKGSTGEPGTLERLFSYKVIQGCARCHEPMGEPGGPNLTKSQFRNSLVSQRSNNLTWNTGYIRTADCGDNYPLVKPSDPINSAVLMAVTQRYGSKTPNSCTPALSHHEGANAVVTGDALEDFVLWIENGAPAN
ncbi:hypothetical protein [Marinospirillum insulare]|uniref:Cytochrome c domain-containing protein n=1 Tax=Marinospirillum insulare TaxID=217169 RepID=A0ABQ6A0J1_9GAMM|nr:hypothetical protein [Marinospirillum insulare]GLR65177.1 hypothetical protein GCM10007878_26160 [Marinospirillum insulare]